MKTKKHAVLICFVILNFISCTKAVVRETEAGEEKMDVPAYVGPITKIPASLTCARGEEFQFSVSAVKWAESYEWSIAETAREQLEMVSGQGSTVITVKVADVGGIIARKSVSVVAVNSLGRSKVREFLAEIVIGETPEVPEEPGDEVKLEGYEIKKYGSKYWMTEHCHEAGPEGNLGRVPDFSTMTFAIPEEVVSRIDAVKGRYYTWYEAMTGIPGCTPEQCPYVKGYSGVDSAGKEFSLDGAESEFNAQIRGVCPEGWHIANVNDWWDLLHTVKDEYGVTDDFVKCGYSFSGGHDPAVAPITKESFAVSGCKVKNIGNVGAWLRGGNGRIADGGVWNQANLQASDKGEKLDLFTPGADAVGFGYFPTGRYASSGDFNTGSVGKWGYIWGIYQGDDPGYASCHNISCTSLNFDVLSTKRDETSKSAALSVRCVKNY